MTGLDDRTDHWVADAVEPAEPVPYRVSERELEWLDGDRVVARRTLEEPPRTPWGTREDEGILPSPCGRWLWHLGYAEGCARVFLLEPGSLEVIGTLDPARRSWGTNRVERLERWCELDAHVTGDAPELLLVFANAGDSFELIVLLSATGEGVVDPLGPRLYDVVAGFVEQRLWAAAITPARDLIVVDDVWRATLVNGRSLDVVAHTQLCSSEDDVRVAESWGRTSDSVLIPVFDGGGGVLEVLELDAKTLAIRRRLPPPLPALRSLFPDRSGRLVSEQDGERFAWRPR